MEKLSKGVERALVLSLENALLQNLYYFLMVFCQFNKLCIITIKRCLDIAIQAPTRNSMKLSFHYFIFNVYLTKTFFPSTIFNPFCNSLMR